MTIFLLYLNTSSLHLLDVLTEILVFLTFNFFKASYNQINLLLMDIDWDSKFSRLCTEETYSCFLSLVHIFLKFIPLKQPLNPKNPPWTRSIPNAIKHSKTQVWLKYKDGHSRFGKLSP